MTISMSPLAGGRPGTTPEVLSTLMAPAAWEALSRLAKVSVSTASMLRLASRGLVPLFTLSVTVMSLPPAPVLAAVRTSAGTASGVGRGTSSLAANLPWARASSTVASVVWRMLLHAVVSCTVDPASWKADSGTDSWPTPEPVNDTGPIPVSEVVLVTAHLLEQHPVCRLQKGCPWRCTALSRGPQRPCHCSVTRTSPERHGPRQRRARHGVRRRR